MNFRIARHCNDLSSMITFYKDLLGLKVLGQFEDHDGYDGVFLGMKNESWHLEFTQSSEEADHKFDPEDLLVFYADSKKELESIISRMAKAGIKKQKAKNPYWNANGNMYLDPDGFQIIISENKKSTQL